MTQLQKDPTVQLANSGDTESLEANETLYRGGRLTRYAIRPLLMAALVTALLVSLLTLIVTVVGDARWYTLTPFLFLVALECVYTTGWLQQPQQLPLDRTAYRGAELVLLLLIVRLAARAVFGTGWPDAAEFGSYVRAPQLLFLDAPFLVTLALAGIGWYMAMVLSKLFTTLDVTSYELSFYSLPTAERKARADDKPIRVGRNEILQRYTVFWLWGGVLIILATGLSTLEQQSLDTILAPLAAGRANLEPHLLAALLVYFAVGLWLLGQARLMHAHARWLVNNVRPDPASRRSWQRYSLLALLLVFVLAAFLPIGSTTAMSQLVGLLIYALLFLANALIILVTLPFALLLALFSGGDAQFEPPTPFDPAAMFSDQPPAGENGFSEILAIVLSSGFWAVFLVVVVIAALFFWRERRPDSARASMEKIWTQVSAWLAQMWARLIGTTQTLRASVLELMPQQEEDEPLDRAEPSRWRYLRVRGLSPRDQIRYFYLSAVRRARDNGITRIPGETPREYLADLQENWPEAQESLDDLTEAFLRARYSEKEIGKGDVPPVKETWKNVRRELRQKPRGHQEGSDEQG